MTHLNVLVEHVAVVEAGSPVTASVFGQQSESLVQSALVRAQATAGQQQHTWVSGWVEHLAQRMKYAVVGIHPQWSPGTEP